MAILAECPQCHRKQSIKNKKCCCGADMDAERRKKKRVKYYIVYRVNGKQRWKSVSSFKDLNPYSIKDATEAEAKFKVLCKENKITLFDQKPTQKWTFQELSNWYLELPAVQKKNFPRKKIAIKKFNDIMGDKFVNDLIQTDLENYQAEREKQGFAPKTIDDEVQEARSMVNKGVINSKVTGIAGDTLKAFDETKKLLKRGENRRDRVITHEEFEGLMAHSPQHLKNILAIGYYTGMRRKEILNLLWYKTFRGNAGNVQQIPKVDLENRIIHLEEHETKEKKPKDIPICEELYQILSNLPKDNDYVFTYHKKPIRAFSRSFKTACEKAGILYGRFEQGGLIFHDLRHTFITNMRKAGVSKSVRMAVAGHSTEEMALRYDTVDMKDKQDAISQYEDYLQNVSQTVRQEPLH
jgi:integrase